MQVVIGHWLDLMNIDGWIPGHWSMDRNNERFVQDTSQATAPSLFLTLESLINKMEKENEMVRTENTLCVLCINI